MSPDLDEAIQRLQRATWDEPLESDLRLVLAALREATGHYHSTACHHGFHDRCRKVCKFCPERCGCECHGGSDAR